MMRASEAFRPIAQSAAVLLGLVAALAGAAPAAVLAQQQPAPAVRDIDTRARDSGPVATSALRARAALERSLGDEGAVSTDRVSGATRLVARTDGSLTRGGSADPPDDIALGYVRAHASAFRLAAADLDGLRLTSRYRSPSGVTHLAYAQTHAGVASYDNVLLASIDRNRRLLGVGGSAIASLAVDSVTPAIGSAQALAVANDDVGGSLLAPRAREGSGPERPTSYSNGDRARLTIFSDGRAERLAWRLEVTADDGLLYEVVVDATSAAVLLRRSLTAFVSNASVHEYHPGAASGGVRQTVDLDAHPTWLDDDSRLRGNNAHAYADAGGVNGFDPGEDVAPFAGTDWDYPQTLFAPGGQLCPLPGCTWDSGDATTKAVNRGQATTQLFYFVNRFHDHLEEPPIGFTHAARNFEFTDADGPAGPGLGGDRVRAESDNSSADPFFNNATMQTPADGSSPRLQMFFFKPTGKDPSARSLNAADAADIVYHEYAHGLTNRSVGSGTGLTKDQSKALGEGWSDWYALDYLAAQGHVTDTAADGELQVGAYLIPGGFRRQGADCPVGSSGPACPGVSGAGPGGFTLGDLGKSGTPFSIHDNGEIWLETLWDLRSALGSTIARTIVTEGLRLAPNDPSFLEARDAVILADQAIGGANHRTLWTLFAARGMGYSATTTSSAATSAVESFDLPPGLRTTDPPPPAPLPDPLPAPAPPPPPPATVPALRPAPFPAKIEVLRAGVTGGRLDVLAAITARASGRVKVSYQSSGVMTRFTVPIARGRIRVARRLRAGQRRRPTGILTLTYDGTATVQPDGVKLRAAAGKAKLARRQALIDARGRLRVAGTISPRARGVVRLRLGYTPSGGAATFLNYSAPIAGGAWSLTELLPREAAAAGGQLSIQFTGYARAGIRGEQDSKEVRPPPG